MSHRDSPKIQGILRNDENQPVSPSSLLGVNHAPSPREASKSVSIAPKAENISPLMLGSEKDVDDLELDRGTSGPRQHRARGPNSKRLSGRRAHNSSVSSLHSVLGQATDGENEEEHHMFSGGLVGQISTWIREEKAKRDARKLRKAADLQAHQDAISLDGSGEGSSKSRRRSSNESIDLGRLEHILKESLHLEKSRRPSLLHHHLRKKPSIKNLHKSSYGAASSDTEYLDGDALVPSAEAWLDNTKTLAGGNMEDGESINTTKAWASFKYEIVRIIHTLRLKGWRRVPMEMSNEIDVERLSGALTNAVYVVSPPENLPSRPSTGGGEGKKPSQRPPPPKLLLRIYGPQVEHLIDREAELQILRRLARKRIGPRMLGTFSNGRFEEYFHARALTPQDLRNPDTSKQIAKRMRELHEGIDLLERERDEGAFVWRNWDKWVQRVEDVVSWLDGEILKQKDPKACSGVESWKARGFVCGTDWSLFKRTVERYRDWLEAQYTEPGQLRARYVFAHNDTQYGNILRMMPSGTSPLLLPNNTHKQLVVIDFEYASANTPGLEFANHFTEWCYNYHDSTTSWRCNTNYYPTHEEQDRFLRAYVRHRPQFNVSTPSLGPSDAPSTPAAVSKRPAGPTSSISNFMLDARAPPEQTQSTSTQSAADAEYAAQEDAEVNALLRETRMWRLANSAQWVAWGIVQAKVPGMPMFSPSPGNDVPTITNISASPEGITPGVGQGTDPLDEEGKAMQADIHDKRPDPNEEDDAAAEEEFDYLAYARDRAMFFWGDALALGIVKAEELPEDVKAGIKRAEG